MMKCILWCEICFFLLLTCCSAQTVFQKEKRDYIWLTGYSSNPNILIVGGTRIDFNYDPPLVTYEYRDLNFERTNASMSDIEGNLLFYTNGIAIHNSMNELIENGEGLNPDPYTENWIDGGYSLPQGALVLPHPAIPDRYVIFHSTISVVIPAIELNNYIPLHCYYTIVNIASGEVGTIPEKNALILSDTFDFGKLTAVRHANGRDWWIAVQEYYANRYYLMLLSPEGISVQPVQTLGPPRPTGLGQAVFSPNGRKYVLFSTISVQDGQFVDIYDYERCSGQLHNHIPIMYNDTAFSGGVAISPNSRFLYVSSNRYVYQYDLEAEDIEASREVVAVHDGFLAPEPFPLPVKFFLCQLAPDNKIYISATNGVPYLHVIHNPNAKGAACQIEQHGLQLPTLNAFGIPNAPYYGLGPEDGSPCDTLGIDHHPQADFRYITETSTVNFYDYSRFFPTQWHWTFGDGSSSTERDPVHAYAESGVYEVCLIVSNMNASDTLCQELEVVVTATEETTTQKALLKVFPNPAKQYVVLQLPGAVLRPGVVGPLAWTLYDALGREVRRVTLQYPEAQTVVSLENVAPGMYFWQLTRGGEVLQVGKMSVVK